MGGKPLKEGSANDNGRDGAGDGGKRRARVLSDRSGPREREECNKQRGNKAQARHWKRGLGAARRAGATKPQGQPSKEAEHRNQSKARKEKESPGTGNWREAGANLAGRRAKRAWDGGAGEGNVETELRGGRRKADEEEEEEEGCREHAGEEERGTDTALLHAKGRSSVTASVLARGAVAKGGGGTGVPRSAAKKLPRELRLAKEGGLPGGVARTFLGALAAAAATTGATAGAMGARARAGCLAGGAGRSAADERSI